MNTKIVNEYEDLVFGPRRKEIKSVADVESLMGKRVLVCLQTDKQIVGRLGRNSFANQTLCITTGYGSEELYGKFFFELNQVDWISEIETLVEPELAQARRLLISTRQSCAFHEQNTERVKAERDAAIAKLKQIAYFCDTHADGTPDATPLDKFANAILGISQ